MASMGPMGGSLFGAVIRALPRGGETSCRAVAAKQGEPQLLINPMGNASPGVGGGWQVAQHDERFVVGHGKEPLSCP